MHWSIKHMLIAYDHMAASRCGGSGRLLTVATFCWISKEWRVDPLGRRQGRIVGRDLGEIGSGDDGSGIFWKVRQREIATNQSNIWQHTDLYFVRSQIFCPEVRHTGMMSGCFCMCIATTPWPNCVSCRANITYTGGNMPMSLFGQLPSQYSLPG